MLLFQIIHFFTNEHKLQDAPEQSGFIKNISFKKVRINGTTVSEDDFILGKENISDIHFK